jgi:hypothetical protein
MADFQKRVLSVWTIVRCPNSEPPSSFRRADPPGLSHLKMGQSLFLALSVTKQNLFAIGVVCFVICIASRFEANARAENEAGMVIRSFAAV